MNKILATSLFEMTGRFGGFVFTETGKRRMLLHSGEGDYLLKVPRLLRRRIIGKFRPGELIHIAGSEEQDPATGATKRVVSQVLPDAAGSTGTVTTVLLSAPSFAAICPIRVCAKKNCWRNGGRELWDSLKHELATRGLTDQIELRQVGCLDRCKRAPNTDWGNNEFSRCSPNDASAIIARAAGNLPPRTSDK